jgi:hypothetical protein
LAPIDGIISHFKQDGITGKTAAINILSTVNFFSLNKRDFQPKMKGFRKSNVFCKKDVNKVSYL